MAQQALMIAGIRNEINRVLSIVEDAQARAAAVVQGWNKLGGASFLTGYDWTGSDISEQEFIDAVSSLSSLFPDVLGTDGTNLYKMKW